MTDTVLCVTAGKCVGKTYRSVSEKCRKAGHFCANAARSTAEETQLICARVGNLFKKVDTDSRLAHWEMRQRDKFAALGEKLYRLREENLEKMFPESDLRGVLDPVMEDESHIKKIKDEIRRQNKRMQDLAVFRHAIGQLKSRESRVRHVALRILEKLDRKEAVPRLVNLVDDPDKDIRRKAKELIRKLSEAT